MTTDAENLKPKAQRKQKPKVRARMVQARAKAQRKQKQSQQQRVTQNQIVNVNVAALARTRAKAKAKPKASMQMQAPPAAATSLLNQMTAPRIDFGFNATDRLRQMESNNTASQQTLMMLASRLAALQANPIVLSPGSNQAVANTQPINVPAPVVADVDAVQVVPDAVAQVADVSTLSDDEDAADALGASASTPIDFSSLSTSDRQWKKIKPPTGGPAEYYHAILASTPISRQAFDKKLGNKRKLLKQFIGMNNL